MLQRGDILHKMKSDMLITWTEDGQLACYHLATSGCPAQAARPGTMHDEVQRNDSDQA